jgi:hypothetical protein
MTSDKQLLEQALENLDEYYITTPEGKELVTAIRARLEQPEQEPHCYMDEYGNVEGEIKRYMEEEGGWFPVYTTPPAAQRQWVGLTDEEMYFAIRPLYKTDALANAAVALSKDEYRAIEAKRKEKNT